ncbi:NADP-dependent oxidoreductase [Paradevosia shaoguanensis]|uniref:NADP-dependent oxidoreductase n=1 Tax=Paradevosia shaoguanensis TaxID=1335043 RepID=A0AA41QNU2_9HYPH|nr:NADP-dependent oxidoreductase [Paradevosia shaoguanensis]MCF1743487.1 NADP-dependent oxidoreductase [Paradevosia shaoguanensis]MCI0127970.1 NADP-dependent oxidoreductase [Paradevosia shaoguanensis]
MRAARFASFGGPEVLSIDDIPIPEPGRGEVRVRVKAAAIQPFDRRVRIGQIPLPPGTTLPVTTGNEFSGIIDALGADVTGFSPGDAVAGRRAFGAVAEYVIVPAVDIARKPETLSFAEGATLSGTAQTADTAIESLGIGPGDTLLIHGAAGGVGSFATQIAVQRGAKVIGTGSQANQAYIASLGASPLVYGGGLRERIIAAAPHGLTAILDCVGGPTLDLSLTLGVPLDRIATLGDMGRTRQLGIRSVEGVRDGMRLARLLDLAAKGQLKANVRRIYPMNEIIEAHRELDAGHGHGKIVIEVA